MYADPANGKARQGRTEHSAQLPSRATPSRGIRIYFLGHDQRNQRKYGRPQKRPYDSSEKHQKIDRVKNSMGFRPFHHRR